MTLNEILLIKKISSTEFTSSTLSDYIYILTALSIKLSRMANNKNLPSTFRVSLSEDVDMINSVLNDLKKLN